MKISKLFAIVLIITFALSINAQNYKQLENLADKLNEQADELVDRTSDDIKKGNAVTGIEIERAFLAEQILASIKLMKRLVEDKYDLSELRSGGNILIEIARRIPTAGANMNEWNNVKNSINSLNVELQSNQNEVFAKPVADDDNDTNVGDFRSGKVFWTGVVDATVHLVIKGTKIKTLTKSGKTYPDGIPSFTSALPNTGNYQINVDKKDGRGNVKIIQQPNNNNDYTAIVEIFDKGGGAKSYTLEISW